eukprot:1162107-Pelagomonas_calceolata.AAC.2
MKKYSVDAVKACFHLPTFKVMCTNKNSSNNNNKPRCAADHLNAACAWHVGMCGNACAFGHSESMMQGAQQTPTRASSAAAKPTSHGSHGTAASLPPHPPPLQASTPPRQQQAQAEMLPQGLQAIESIS